MELSLSDAARLLGKSRRQVRYLIEHGQLLAKKVGGRWVVKRKDLPLTEAQISRGLVEQGRLKEVIESALGVDHEGKAKKRYSVTDLKAFEVGRGMLCAIRDTLGEQSPATRRLSEALALIACGCHTFHKRDKTMYYQRAREQICYGLTELLVSNKEPAVKLAESIECEWLPTLGSMLRSVEKRRT